MIITELGIIDFIYEYNCGISYRQLRKIVEKCFEEFYLNEDKILYLVNYFILILSKGWFDIEGSVFHIRIYLRRISSIVAGRRGIKKLMYKNNHSHSLYKAINNVMRDIEKKNGNKYMVLFHG